MGRARASTGGNARTAGTSRAHSPPTARSGTCGRSAGRSSIAPSPCSATSATSRIAAARRAPPGPERVLLAPTPRGRAALRRWLARPVEHVRDLRSELLLKLLLLDRAGLDRTPLLRAQLEELERGENSLVQRVAASEGFDRTVAIWRLTSARAARAFVEALLDERAEEPVQYHAIGVVRSSHRRARRDAAAARRRPYRAVADRRSASHTAAASSTSTASPTCG